MRGTLNDEKEKAIKEGREIKPLGIEPLTDEKYITIIDKLVEKHKPIEEYLFRDMGNILMYIDSQIAEATMLHNANMGIPCLPIHDSFIVDVRVLSDLNLIMLEYFKQALKQWIQIKDNLNDILDEILYRFLNQIEEKLKDWDRNKDRLIPILEGIKKSLPERKKNFLKMLEMPAAQKLFGPEKVANLRQEFGS